MMMIFQDPYASLNPRKRVGFIVGESLQIGKMGTASEIKRRVQELLEVVGPQPRALQPLSARVLGRAAPADRDRPRPRGEPEADRRRRARLGARRLRPGADPQPAQGSPVGVRAHLHLHRARPQRRSLHLGSRDGDVPRKGGGGRTAAQLYSEPQHPYSGALLSAVPIANPRVGRSRKAVVLEGDVPNPINPPSGCRFHPRCPRFQEGVCDVVEPRITEVATAHSAACFFPLERWPMSADEMEFVESSVVEQKKREVVPAELAAEPATTPA